MSHVINRQTKITQSTESNQVIVVGDYQRVVAIFLLT
ncbi:hypothetical protein predicted by Glimmer/Critica [Lactiplantibacillus plantarum]|nr:hypothetical protein predicted by Glimmer/Critica [Lactiplantibacillus plantarum]